MAKTWALHIQLLGKLDKNLIFKNKTDHCEVMLSKHGLYPKTGGNLLPCEKMSALDIRLWLLFLCDGKTLLHEVSKKLKVPIEVVYQEAKILSDMNVLEKVGPD
jgi:aminopeptidase-like protein